MENQLEIALITYNRCLSLAATLEQLARSPFSHLKITLYDNHSSDGTDEVCQHYVEHFPNLLIVRHGKNIGGGPNYLRAIERAKLPYTWVLCDDDTYDFSDCSDVMAALREDGPDIIWVSDEHLGAWECGLMTTADELMERGARYYPALSFIPSVIFRTSLFDDDCLRQGYQFYEFLYPQFPFIHASVDRKYSVYVAKKPIITRGWGSTGVSPFQQYAAWIKCCLSVPDDHLRARITEDLTVTGGGQTKELFAIIACERMDFARNPSRFWKNIMLMYLCYTGAQRINLILSLALGMALPVVVLRWLRALRYRLRGFRYVPGEFDRRDVYDS